MVRRINISYLFQLAWANILTSAIGSPRHRRLGERPIRSRLFAQSLCVSEHWQGHLQSRHPWPCQDRRTVVVARRQRTQLVEKDSMPGFNRWHLLKGLTALLCIFGVVSLALTYFIPTPPTKIAMGTSVIKGTTYDYYAQRYRERFARANVKLEFRESPDRWRLSVFCRMRFPAFNLPLCMGALRTASTRPDCCRWGLFITIPFGFFTPRPSRLTVCRNSKANASPLGRRGPLFGKQPSTSLAQMASRPRPRHFCLSRDQLLSRH